MAALAADSWPIRDAASVTAGVLTRHHPTEMIGVQGTAGVLTRHHPTEMIDVQGTQREGRGGGSGGGGGGENGDSKGGGGGGGGDVLDLCLDAWSAGKTTPNPNPSPNPA